MHTFTEYLAEARDQSRSAHFFDMDETIFSHDNSKLRVNVRDQNGRVVRRLTNQQFNDYKLAPGQKYDFAQFRSAATFEKSAKPIRPMLAKMKAIHRNGGNTQILTARSDFDDKNRFGRHMGKFGIDINKIHVRRAGNLPHTPAQNKAVMVSGLIKKHGYNEVHLYDDSHSNLDHFLALKAKHPDVTFHAHHVDYDHGTGQVKITSRKS